MTSKARASSHRTKKAGKKAMTGGFWPFSKKKNNPVTQTPASHTTAPIHNYESNLKKEQNKLHTELNNLEKKLTKLHGERQTENVTGQMPLNTSEIDKEISNTLTEIQSIKYRLDEIRTAINPPQGLN